MRKIKLGTRKSILALAQAKITANIILQNTGIECELVQIVTSGDKEKTKPLYEMGGKGLFIKEIEEALVKNEIDIAVHSLKDIPGIIPESLMIGAMLERDDPRDVLLCKVATSIAELPQNAKIGTTSPRRIIYLKKLRPDLNICTLRGNWDTRYKKVIEGEFDGAVLAMAGYNRLHGRFDDKFLHPIAITEMLPAIGQGVIALEIRKDDDFMLEICRQINHQLTWDLVSVERGFLEHLEAGCKTPAAALAQKDGNGIKVDFMLATDDWQNITTHTASCGIKEGYELGKKVASEMKKRLI